MRTFTYLALLCVLLLELSTPSTIEATESGKLERVDILDTQGFGGSIQALSILAPKGWQTSGGIQWKINNRGCGQTGTTIAWKAVSADGQSVVEILPEQTWSGNNLGTPSQGVCPNLWIESAKEYLQLYVSEQRPGAQVLRYRDRPDIEQEHKQFNSVQRLAFGELRSWVDAGEVRLLYTENGMVKEELLAFMIRFQLNSMPGVYPGEVRKYLTIASAPGFSFKTPKGQLDSKLAESIRVSGKPYPEWSRRMAQHQAKMRQINQKGAQQRHQIRMQTNKEIAAIHQQTRDNATRSQDRINKKFNQAIREVDEYKRPGNEGSVELPSGAKHSWALDNGDFIQTDDAGFKPYRELGIDGVELERVP